MAPKPRSSTGVLRRLLPAAIVLIALALAVAFDLHRYLSFETLREHRQTLLAAVGERPLICALVFMLLYALAVAVSIPGAAILTLAGGFLFGTWLGGLLAVIGATIGAVVVFLIARTAVGEVLRRKAGPWLSRMQAGFAANALSYLLVLRLVPIFPFWLVNLVPALLGVGLSTYALATFLGIMPGTFVFAGVGNGLGAVFDAGGTPNVDLFLEPQVFLPLLGLAVLAMVPVFYGRIVRPKAPRGS